MGIMMKIHNVKNIDDFTFDIPVEKGLYALTGENGSGKSTVISCAAAAFYVPSFYDYFGNPRDGAYIQFEFNGRVRTIGEVSGKWKVPYKASHLGITGFYEGSIVYGNRFKDIEYSLLNKLSIVGREQLEEASCFVKENLGRILHDDKSFYQKLYVLKSNPAIEMGLKRAMYYYENKGALISQLNMSTGENLLLTILYAIEKRLQKEVYGSAPAFMFLDEIELALHSSALRRLVVFMKEIAEQNNIAILFSTHSIDLINSITPEHIYYLHRFLDGSIEAMNPCFPVYATRYLEASNHGYDYIILVEDKLSQLIVEKILEEKRLLSNKRVLVIPIGGWTQVLQFAYDAGRAYLLSRSTKMLIVLDRDIKEDVHQFVKKEKMGFSSDPHYLPIKSLEKFLLEKLILNTDNKLFKELDDYVFQGKSLNLIIKDYDRKVREGEYKDKEKIKSGKMFYNDLKDQLRHMRKDDMVLISVIVRYLFDSRNQEIEELTNFFARELG